MKKIIAMLLTLVMTLSLLAACGQNAEAPAADADTDPADIVTIMVNIKGLGGSIEITDDGHVRLNGSDLYESYALFSNSGTNDMSYPLDIPENSWFVLGDNRGSSVDSRSSILGLIDDEQMLGKVFIRVWPLTRFQVFDKNFFPQLVDSLLPG